jgi:UDP-N-acetylmuramoyl-tripeptide--D-alanyl-D-alanine ligase
MIYYIDERTILVEDSLSALQELAKFHRKYLNLPIIALTGSNGKTTTKS